MVSKSCQCTVTEDRSITTAGNIVYVWDGDKRQFPEDVRFLYIRMPVTWREAQPGVNDLDPQYADTPVDIGWPTTHPLNKGRQHTWQLSGTAEKPTLSPSLHWIDVWHGWLTDGHLVSC